MRGQCSPCELFSELAPPLVQANFRLRLRQKGDVGCMKNQAIASVTKHAVFALLSRALIAKGRRNARARSTKFCGVLASRRK